MSRMTPEFIAAMTRMMASYGKPIPDAPVMQAWWTELAQFPAAVIDQAFAAYRLERPDFAPVPNSIAARCRLLDGRPDENEAWAQSLVSRDERETVVWTQEMAEAFNLARPLIESGDEIGARMAFKDAYSRLVAAARAANRPVAWTVSAGWDAERRQLAVQKATTAGLLSGPQPHLLLTDESDSAPVRPEGLERVLEAVAAINKTIPTTSQYDLDEELRDLEQRERADKQMRDYLAKHPEARYGSLKPARSA